eukprot:Gb_37730 [translate_table: standard]
MQQFRARDLGHRRIHTSCVVSLSERCLVCA